ncbi:MULTISPECIES: hypothetical protein [unclassified Kitasatospora]|uniref:hypothetical protein n=1 Tax=unclassified Kitasatospora TaxID=2633591 RepID=UPI0038179B67
MAKDVAGQRITYSYDRMGRLASAVAPGVELAHRYDQLGRLASENVNGRILAIECDAASRRIRRVTPRASAVLHCGFSESGLFLGHCNKHVL